MKTIFTLLCCSVMLITQAQEKIKKSYPVKAGQQLELTFDYPQNIKLSTWSGNEVVVEASVSINDGKHNDAFILDSKQKGDVLSINGYIKDMKKLPQTYRIKTDKEKIVFSSKEAMQAYTAKLEGTQYNMMMGVETEITIEIKVPETVAYTMANAKYGMLELNNFNGKIKAESQFGGIDATIREAYTGKLNAVTEFGSIYSNLDLKVTNSEEKNFYTSITMGHGKGHEYALTSKFGKIYLRKPAK